MAAFVREGSFPDRSAFLSKLKEKLAHLRTGPLAGMTETWEQENGSDIARLAGFGVNFRFQVSESNWRCEGELPDWLPIPPKQIEDRFDKEFSELMSQD